jgi:hypothetical protein
MKGVMSSLKCVPIMFWLISSGFFSYSKLFPSRKNEGKRIKKKKKNSRKVNVICVPKVMPMPLP